MNRSIQSPALPFSFQTKHIPLKRAFDIVFSASTLLFFAPLLILIAVAVKCTSRGSIFYAHTRIGRGGKPFLLYKFRTMHPDAHKRLEHVLAQDPKLRREWETSYKLKNDPRVTLLGFFLRKSSLDELPQFWNVLKGDLSVVGPRAVVYNEILTHYREKAAKIFSIRPGITGLWQTSGRSDISYSTRILLDEYYVNNHNLLLDLKLILLTIPIIFWPRGAY